MSTEQENAKVSQQLVNGDSDGIQIKSSPALSDSKNNEITKEAVRLAPFVGFLSKLF